MTQQHSLWRYNTNLECFDLFWDCKSGLDKTPFTQENNPYNIIFVSAQRPQAVISMDLPQYAPSAETPYYEPRKAMH